MVDISGLDKAAVLAALYNASRPLGMGWLQFTPEDMTVEEARELIDSHDGNPQWALMFDYVYGRVMKVNLIKDSFNPAMYDRDNGEGAAQAVIDELRSKS